MARLFTEQELEELRRADAELDEEYSLTMEDIELSRKLDKNAKFDRMDNHEKKIAAQQAAYYEANREKIAAQKAAYREANREKYNAYMREYFRKRRAAKKAAHGAATPKGGKTNMDGAIVAQNRSIFND